MNRVNAPDDKTAIQSRNQHSHPRDDRSINDCALKDRPSAFDRKHSINVELGTHDWSIHRTSKLSDRSSDLSKAKTPRHNPKAKPGSLQRLVELSRFAAGEC